MHELNLDHIKGKNSDSEYCESYNIELMARIL